MRILKTLAVTTGMAVALAWAPMPGFGWHIARWVAYLPILTVSARYGAWAGLFAGVAASLLWALLALSGTGGMPWLTILMPDLAAVGWFGGRLLKVSAFSRQRYSTGGAVAWPERKRFQETEIDLNLTPIVSIQSAAGLLAEEGTPADQRQELAAIISKECGRLSANITGLLERQTSLSQPHFRQTEITSILDAAVRNVQFVHCDQGIAVRQEVAPELPPIQCDPDELRSLLVRLMMAVLHLAPGGTDVVLSARHDGDGVAVDIGGLGKHTLAGVLKRLFQPSPRTSDLGLATAYDIVREHGGRIEAKGNVGKGRRFSVWLPLRRNRENGDQEGIGRGGR